MKQHILIIDDNDDDILLTKLVLKKIRKQLTVDIAMSGEAGLVFLREEQFLPSLILLDLKMPGRDGIDVLRTIRAEERLRGIPVVVVTHSDLESDREASFRNGASGFLNKSVDLGQFTRQVRNELEKWI